MKGTHFLYSIATLAVGSLLAIFASYATDTLPMHTPRTPPRVIAATPVAKDCGCCSKITAQDLKTFRQRNEALRNQRQAYANTIAPVIFSPSKRYSDTVTSRRPRSI